MKDLCDLFELNHLIEDPTRFKRSNPSCIDNFYTNNKTSFLIHLLSRLALLITITICTMLSSRFCEGPPKFIYYRSYNNYNKEEFENALKPRLLSSKNSEVVFLIF